VPCYLDVPPRFNDCMWSLEHAGRS